MTNKKIKNDIVEFRQQYLRSILGDLNIPSAILDKYKIIEQISESKRSKVFLIIDKNNNKKFVLKVFDEQKNSSHYKILSQLNHSCIPKFVDAEEQNGKIYLVREYFEGETLEMLMEKSDVLNESDALNAAVQICDILNYLHTRETPIIYRDIKAENIIITEDGTVKLIDFDISREYDEDAKHDTVYYGTKEYSPPEQFGFSQTDSRTDIYSLGILLLYMLTGSKDQKDISNINNTRLKKIIAKCTAFSPSDRYKSALSLQKELNKAKKQEKTMRLKWAVCFCVITLILGFIIGFSMRQVPKAASVISNNSDEAVVFQSQLIEQAVRMQLNKEDDEEIYMYELKQIDSLYICGNQVFDGSQRLLFDYVEHNEQQELYFESYQGEHISIKRGNVESIEDIAMMSNLKHLDLMYQNITDISPIENLPIEWLQLPGNYISDLTPLENLPLIFYLNIDGNPVLDISALSCLERLKVLDASETYIYDLQPLSNIQALGSIYINNANIIDVSPLENLTLRDCFLEGNDITDFSALDGTENLHVDDD